MPHPVTRGYDWQGIRDRFPLVDVVGGAVALKKKGREYVGLCPFHNERTPSFFVVPEKGFFHCHGCGAHGDVIDFTARHEGITAAEAVSRLTHGDAPRLSEADRAERESWQREQEQAEALRAEQASALARKHWDAAHPVDGANSYLDRKQIAPHCARTKAGKLLLPVCDADGDIISVQAIADDGAKMFIADAPTRLGRCYIGINMGRTIVCEGFATGASIYEALPDQVCVTFSKLNMERVARQLVEAGRNIVLASDTNCADEMRALAAELDCPVAVPPVGSDFNDTACDTGHGIEAVRACFSAALNEYQNRPVHVPPPHCAIGFVDAFDFDETKIPMRPWIVPGALLAGSTHFLAAPGGTGKSLFTLQFAIMLASGQPWGKWKPKRTCNVLIINAEDDVDEQRRRMSAARSIMDGHAVRPGRMMVADNPASIMTARMDDKSRRLVPTPLVKEMVDVIRHYAIDAVIVDPFAETFEGDENSNSDTKWAMQIWRDQIARATGCAVYLVHHTTKGSADKAGNTDAIRGAGALVNSARLASTLFVMTESEAEALGVNPDRRFRYVRYDDAKSNHTLAGARQWFEKVSVVINNGPAGHSESGDEVGALRPWDPDGIADISQDRMEALLDAVDTGYIDADGLCTDAPFSPALRGGSPRWIGNLIMDMIGCEEAQAKRIFSILVDRGTLAIRDCNDPISKRMTKGVFRADSESEAT